LATILANDLTVLFVVNALLRRHRHEEILVEPFGQLFQNLRLGSRCARERAISCGIGSPHWTISATGSSKKLRKPASFARFARVSRTVLADRLVTRKLCRGYGNEELVWIDNRARRAIAA